MLDSWAHEAGVRLSFIRPGKPNENAYIESFNGKFRNECLNEHWFITMAQARRIIEAWRIEYNTERTHSSVVGAATERDNSGCGQYRPFGHVLTLGVASATILPLE